MLYPTLWRASAAPSAWSEMFNARREMDQVLDRFFGRAATGGQGISKWEPAVDVRETGDAIHVTAELPGLAREDVSVTVENGVLSIAGEKKQEIKEGDEGADYYLFERRYGRFERSFTLPRSVKADDVKARFDNGVLQVTLPKAEEAKPRRVQIDVNGKRN